MHPDDKATLVSECCADVRKALRARTGPEPEPGLFAALPTADLTASLAPMVSGAIDLMVTLLGPTLGNLVIADRAVIRTLISDHTLAFIDGLVHDLQAVPPA